MCSVPVDAEENELKLTIGFLLLHAMAPDPGCL